MLKDFKDFAVKGNVIDLAVGVIIGGAFGKIVASLVNDIIMPVVGLLVRNVDFANLFISLDGTYYPSLAAAKEAAAATLNYGMFINIIIEFIIITFSIFLVIKQLSKLKKEDVIEEEEVTTKDCPYCFTEIHLEATKCPNCTSTIE